MPIRDFAELSARGRRLYHVWPDAAHQECDWVPPGKKVGEGMSVEQAMSAALKLETLIGRLGKEHDLLRGLEVNLSVAAWHEDERSFEHLHWAKQEALLLHRAIIERLGPLPSALHVTPTWIAGKEALGIARRFGRDYLPSELSKLARKNPPPFIFQSDGHSMSVRLDSFVAFLWMEGPKKKRRTKDGVSDNEAAKRLAKEKKRRQGGESR